MERLHKINYTIILVGIVLMTIMTCASYGLNELAFRGCAVMIIAGIAVAICRNVVKDDLAKALCITLIPGIASIVYSAVCGGNSCAFMSCYIYLAMTSIYFDRRCIMYYAIPIGILGFVCTMIDYRIVDGNEGNFSAALIQVFFFVFIAAVLINATNRGRSLIEESEKTVALVKDSRNVATGISANLNVAIDECRSEVSKLSEQAATVSEAADQMGSVIEHTTNATLSVTEQVKSASTQIEKNYDLAGKLEQNFNNVNLAVDAGNRDAALVRTELQEMSGIVMSAQEATDSLLEEMKTITNILGEINAIASKTNLLSLNASIEAARAGEHGKGFAVVADEIRNLSQQSSDASNNIKSIIERLAETTNTVSEKITAGAQAAVNGVERMGKLLEVFDGIKYTADNANKVVSEEYQVIEAVKSNFDDINKEIETLVATTEENTAMITNIAESISRQHESVGSVENEIISISDLSGTLKEHFSAE